MKESWSRRRVLKQLPATSVAAVLPRDEKTVAFNGTPVQVKF